MHLQAIDPRVQALPLVTTVNDEVTVAPIVLKDELVVAIRRAIDRRDGGDREKSIREVPLVLVVRLLLATIPNPIPLPLDLGETFARGLFLLTLHLLGHLLTLELCEVAISHLNEDLSRVLSLRGDLAQIALKDHPEQRKFLLALPFALGLDEARLVAQFFVSLDDFHRERRILVDACDGHVLVVIVTLLPECDQQCADILAVFRKLDFLLLIPEIVFVQHVILRLVAEFCDRRVPHPSDRHQPDVALGCALRNIHTLRLLPAHIVGDSCGERAPEETNNHLVL
mmetsp:Transcript_61280/g.171360  ORF Transcript_61280/g.171360 Transcript_61280/m.171360 type:complete len:284 (-) Transcript_61280:446-1297(-)